MPERHWFAHRTVRGVTFGLRPTRLGRARPVDLTIGLEEEYLLLDPQTGRPVADAENVRRHSRGQPALDPDEVERELLQVQLEVATPVCATLDEAGGHLLRLRSELQTAAAGAGLALASVGAAPLLGPELPPASRTDRYQAVHAKAPRLVDEMLLNGLHVHVAVPSPDAGIHVLNGLRRWLPVLTALAANSPFWDGADSGFASWRTVHFNRWPVSGPPPAFVDADDYEQRVLALLRTNALVDRGQLYWQARLSHRYPTVEIRVADAQLRVEDSVVLAGLLRGLVATGLRSEPTPPPPDELVRAASWQAARDELTSTLVDPATGEKRPAAEEVERLLRHIGPALHELGDAMQVAALVERRLEQGPGARRLRSAAESGGIDRAVNLVLDEFVVG
jgi:carboxylate-amine ligase